MKNEFLKLKVTAIILIVILVVILTLLVSCEKREEFCWYCTVEREIYANGCLVDTATMVYDDRCNLTRDEILIFINQMSGKTTYMSNGVEIMTVDKCGCLKKTCW